MKEVYACMYCEIIWRGSVCWTHCGVINLCYVNDRKRRYVRMIAGDVEVRIGVTHPNSNEGGWTGSQSIVGCYFRVMSRLHEVTY